jgi:hypothetical protein
MFKLNLPEYNFNFRANNSKQQIFDIVRKKYVALTPEEWVRQNFISWLIQELKYPASHIAIEKELLLNEMKKRFDAVVFNKDNKPAMLIECKAPEVKISQKTFDQAARYNMVLKLKYLVITNGLEHYCCEIDFLENKYSFMEIIPNCDKIF